MATIITVAKKAIVSRTTVSRVLNKSPVVNAETRKTVLKTIHELRYTPNIILSKDITKLLNLKVDEVIEVNVEDERLVISRKRQSLKENLLLGIKAKKN